jgi:hypothetical protein
MLPGQFDPFVKQRVYGIQHTLTRLVIFGIASGVGTPWLWLWLKRTAPAW